MKKALFLYQQAQKNTDKGHAAAPPGRTGALKSVVPEQRRNEAMPPAQCSPAPAIPSFDTTARQRRDGVGLRERVRRTRSHGACSRNAVRRNFPRPAVMRCGNAFPSLPRFPAERRTPGVRYPIMQRAAKRRKNGRNAAPAFKARRKNGRESKEKLRAGKAFALPIEGARGE